MRTILLCLLIMTYGKTVGHAVVTEKPEVPNNNNVFIITLDGFRWQELFSGADAALINEVKETSEKARLQKFFWDEDEKKRRKKLMPFFWSVVEQEGQLFGNRNYGSKVNVSNIYALSYPGYNEIFTGNVDPALFSNRKIRNRNITFLEYLNKKPFFKGKVASFASWDMFPYIFNQQRSNLYVNCRNKLFTKDLRESEPDHDDASTRSDFDTYKEAKEYILRKHPKLVHIGLGGTDTYGHKAQYHNYLYQAHLADNIIRQLWELVQASPVYRDRTTFIITTDHGRGSKKTNWHKHGMFVKGSSQTWLALFGNGVRKLGEYKEPVQFYQKQLAGTIGHFLNITSYTSYALPISYFEAIEKDGRAVAGR